LVEFASEAIWSWPFFVANFVSNSGICYMFYFSFQHFNNTTHSILALVVSNKKSTADLQRNIFT
jgi:hypothetical protein